MSNIPTAEEFIMKKEFIPYEQALALKELGFDEPCFKGYTEEYKTLISFSNTHTNTSVEKTLPTKPLTAPLYQQAFRWFREKYKLYCCIERVEYINSDEKGFQWSIFEKCSNVGEELKTYEEAELECLKKLIEICKNN